MKKLLLLASLAAVGGYFAYKKLLGQSEIDDWDDEDMYESAQLHEAVDAPATPTV